MSVSAQPLHTLTCGKPTALTENHCHTPMTRKGLIACMDDTQPPPPHPQLTPGVVFDGDHIGRWLQQQQKPGTWAQLSTEQQVRLTSLGVQPDQTPPPASAHGHAAKGLGKAQQAFQRGLTALTQWIDREGPRPVPRGHTEPTAVDGESDPVPVRLGVWVSNTRARRNRLTTAQLAALAALGVQWA